MYMKTDWLKEAFVPRQSDGQLGEEKWVRTISHPLLQKLSSVILASGGPRVGCELSESLLTKTAR
jgi:hypothetical protein